MQNRTKLSESELQIINCGIIEEPMRVLQTTEESDLKLLRVNCKELIPEDENLKLLISRMYQTVRDENKPGVGIAAPQVGIARRLFIAQRMDKKDNPFEFFINPEIVWFSNIKRRGEEGCLSIPDAYGDVYRSLTIQITYYDMSGTHFQEVVEGFTAVIMQHEMDHLNGVLFTDRMEEQAEIEYYNASPTGEIVYPR
ncbi:peptide deformylase [Myroides phaeus]|uniref:Peptide deformylase n=1 Tax=Myroides phaeus TaxID=702745 RepID=A0A1G8FB66_9FLAO|nr:peptide deformylase [Myroides phaeus]SDH79391.1 peptide deformylase [Myroides phaeus]